MLAYKGICPYVEHQQRECLLAMNPSANSELLTSGSQCVSTAIRKAARKATQFYDLALSETGLRSTQFSILAELKRRGAACSQSDLAAALVMERSALGHSLRPLEREGLIGIVAGEVDGRKRYVALTAEGLRRHAAAEVHWREAQKYFLNVIGHEEGSDIRSRMLAIAENPLLDVNVRIATVSPR
jgi:DNA-binding MarR family transcriptional regulator